MIHVEAIVATTDPVPAYSGVRLPRAELERMAADLRSQNIPARLSHDASRPLRIENVTAEVRQREDGEYELRAEFDADEEGWAEYEAERDARGAPGGMSFTITEPLADIAGSAIQGVVSLTLSADAHHFSDEQIIDAATSLASAGPVEARRLYQFSAIPAAVAIIQAVIQQWDQIPAGLLTNYIYDALRRLRSPETNPGLTLEVTDPDGTKVTAVIPEGMDHAVAERAISAWESVAKRPGTWVATPEGSWRKINVTSEPCARA